MDKEQNIYGVDCHLLKKFNKGDMVSWLVGFKGERSYGLIYDIRANPLIGYPTRNYFIADIETIESGHKSISLGLLTLEAKVNKHKD